MGGMSVTLLPQQEDSVCQARDLEIARLYIQTFHCGDKALRKVI